jgi:hypothetical protein
MTLLIDGIDATDRYLDPRTDWDWNAWCDRRPPSKSITPSRKVAR